MIVLPAMQSPSALLLCWLLLLAPAAAARHPVDANPETRHPVSPPFSFIPYLNTNGRFGFVDGDGQAPFAKTFEDALPFSEGRAAVKSDGRWGYIDLRGHWIVRPRFTEASPFENGKARAAIVKAATRRGFIDLNPLHTSGSRKCFLISPNGHVQSCGDGALAPPASPDIPRHPSESPQLRVMRAPDGRSHGVLDSTGRQIVPFGVYDDLRYQDGDLFVSHGARGWGILDAVRNVEVVTSNRPGFEHLKYTSPDLHPRLLAVRRDDDTWCILDRAGTPLHCGFTRVSHWGESLIAVRDGQQRWGAVDTRGQLVIPFRYDSEFRFRNGLARVRVDDGEFYIDLQGNEYRASMSD